MRFVQIPQDVKVYDNRGVDGGGTFDRYAVVFPDGVCFTMSMAPFANDGITNFIDGGYRPDSKDVRRDTVPPQVAVMIRHLMT
jgi:hypothetical protein